MAKLRFIEETHQYFLGKKELICVSDLMKKHKLSTDYSMVNEDVLNAKADRGTLIHKEIEDYVKTGERGFTNELYDYIELAKGKLVPSNAELRVHNGFIAGTIDQIGFDLVNNVDYVLDIKTGSKTDYSALQWQLSLYSLLLGNNRPQKLYCAHLCDKPKMFEVAPIPREEVEKLLECEKKGEIYQPTQIAIPQFNELMEAKEVLDGLQKTIDEAKAKYDEIVGTIKNLMIDKNIKSFENDLVKISYIAPTERTSIDSVKLKKELPEIAEKYSKISQVSDSVRLTWRE